MLDVHVLVMEYTPPEQVAQCLASIAEAAARAPYPVHIHQIDGPYGHLGKARRLGYGHGTAPFVTHVDDDDWLHEDAFRVLPLEHDAITTGEVQVFGDHHVPLPGARHHLAVYRRAWLQRQPYDRFRFFPDQFLLQIAEAHHVPECVYFHRIQPDSGSRRLRRELAEEAALETRLIRDRELLQAENLTPEQIAAEYDRMLT